MGKTSRLFFVSIVCVRREEQYDRKKRNSLDNTINISCCVCFILRTFIFGTITVKGSSMEPNFHHGDFVIVNKLAYHIGEPKKVILQYVG